MNRKPDLSPLVYGKVPPQATELEEAVLGAIMLESECLASVLEVIPTADAFYADANRRVYAAILDLSRRGGKVDLLTVTDAVRKSGDIEAIGGAYYLSKLTTAVISSAHVMHHAAGIMHYYKLREIIRIAGEAMAAGYEGDAEPDAVASDASAALMAITETGSGDTTVHIGDPAAECLQSVEMAMNNPGRLTGVNTGFREINALTNGWQKQNMIVLAARPSQGKTALAINLMLNSGAPCLFLSLEMSRHETTNRMLAAISGIGLEDIQRGTLSRNQLQALYAAKNKLDSSKIYIDDKAGLSTVNLLSRVRRWTRRKGIELVVIDYLQLMHVPDVRSKNREAQVSEISRGIKLTAKECNVPIIALSQMNRSIEHAKRKPMLSDLRESGSIEQDSDVVAFIWHEEDPNDGRVKNKLVFAKNRQGRVDDVELKFIPATQKWHSLEVDVFGESFNPYAGMPRQAAFEDEPF